MSEPRWQLEALCRGRTAIFFSGDATMRAAAKLLCRRCPVRAPCATEALAEPVEGIWGGLDESERSSWARCSSSSTARRTL